MQPHTHRFGVTQIDVTQFGANKKEGKQQL